MNASTSHDGTLKRIVRSPLFWGAAAIVLLLMLNLMKDPGYLAISVNAENGHLVGNLIDILRASAPILMVAVGMSMVIATGGIDLSVGSVMAVAGAVSMEFLRSAGSTPGAAFAAIGLTLLISALLGAINGVLVAVVGLQPFISTLILMLAGRGLAKVITGGQNTTATNSTFEWMSNGFVFGIPVVFILAIAIVAIVGLIVRRSALGLMVESIGINPKASRMAGVRPLGILMTVYIASGIFAGIAGMFSVATVMTVDVSRTGYQLEMDAILAVVIGGTALTGGKFSISGAAIGALLIATLNKTILFLGVSSSATPAFKAVVILVLCLLQSERVRTWFVRTRRAGPGQPLPTAGLPQTALIMLGEKRKETTV